MAEQPAVGLDHAEWKCPGCATWNTIPPPKVKTRCRECCRPISRALLIEVLVHEREAEIRAWIRADRAGL